MPPNIFPSIFVAGFATSIGVMILYVKLENPGMNIDRQSGLYNQNAFMEYIQQLYGSHKKFSMIMVVINDEEDGFYYDIDLGDEVIKEEDLLKIEKEMKKISKDGKRIVRREISKDEALEMFKDDPYKIDLISRMDESEQAISCYSQGDFTDLCRGPHVETVKELKFFNKKSLF